MNPDVLLVLGILAVAGCIAAIISAFSTSGRSFRLATFLGIVGCGLIVWAAQLNPQGYAANEVPGIFWETIKMAAGF